MRPTPFAIVATIVALLLLPQTSPAQKIDSLLAELERQGDVKKFSTLYDLAVEYDQIQEYEKSLRYVNNAQAVAFKEGDSLSIVYAGWGKGKMLRSADRTFEAIVEMEKVLVISRRNHFDAENSRILNSLGLAYTFEANYDRALETHLESLAFRERNGNPAEICRSLNNIGLVYYKLGDFVNALHYYQRFIALEPNDSEKYYAMINMGLCYCGLREFSTAKTYLNNGLALCSPGVEDEGIANGEFGLGLMYTALGDTSAAEKHFISSLTLAESRNFARYEIEDLIALSQIHQARRGHAAAFQFIQRAEKLALKTRYRELLMGIYDQYAKIYLSKRDFENAFHALEKYLLIRGAIFNETTTRNLMRIHAKFEEKENEEKIASQSLVLALKEETLIQRSKMNVLFGVISVLFIFLTLLLLKLYRNKNVINRLLEKRFFDRTTSAERSALLLERNAHELREFALQTVRDIKQPLVTIEGLSNIMLADAGDERATINNVNQLSKVANTLALLQKKLLILSDERRGLPGEFGK